MAENKLTMFGKTYNTVGSADSNLLLQTRGDLKIRWGNKFIDLVKNGKINVDTDLLFKVESKDKIIKDGIYLIQGEESSEIWLSIKGEIINVIGEVNDNYVAFVKDQNVSSDQKFRALKNIGYYQSSYSDLENSGLQQGLFFVLDENQLYYMQEGKVVKYEQKIVIPNPLELGNIVIDGKNSRISCSNALSIADSTGNYITFDKVNIFHKNIEVNGSILSKNYQTGSRGYRIYLKNSTSTLEVDNIIVRKNLTQPTDILYDDLILLIENNNLVPGKIYVITDFINEWETSYTIDGSTEYYYHPITIKAISSNKLEKTGYYCNNPNWIVEYDPSYRIITETVIDPESNTERERVTYLKGRITKLTDEFGNTANYDFKHKLFKHTSLSDSRTEWFFTFNVPKSSLSNQDIESIEFNCEDEESFFAIHNNSDASLFGKVKNNVLLIDGQFIFENCHINYPYDNSILNGEGSYVISGKFYGNTIYNIFGNNYTFNCDFYNNSIKGLYLKGDNISLESEKTVSFYQNCTYNDNIFIKNIMDSSLNGSISNTIFKGNVKGLNFQGTIQDSSFNKDIDQSTINGNISECKFHKLSQGIVLSGTLNKINIQEDITPSIANYVQTTDTYTLSLINTLEINSVTIPRLALSGQKDCYIRTIQDKVVFHVSANHVDDYTPKGTIVMFNGSQIPEGWAICDGQNGTPNLTGRFIRMVDTGENAGPINNNDLETNGEGTRKAYIKKSVAHTHSYGESTNVDYSELSANYRGGNLIEGTTSTSNVEVYRVKPDGDNTTYYSYSDATYIKESLEEQGSHSHSYSINLPDIVLSGNISVSITQDTQAESSNFVSAINVEPQAYALIFIMKL